MQLIDFEIWAHRHVNKKQFHWEMRFFWCKIAKKNNPEHPKQSNTSNKIQERNLTIIISRKGCCCTYCKSQHTVPRHRKNLDIVTNHCATAYYFFDSTGFPVNRIILTASVSITSSTHLASLERARTKIAPTVHQTFAFMFMTVFLVVPLSYWQTWPPWWLLLVTWLLPWQYEKRRLLQ